MNSSAQDKKEIKQDNKILWALMIFVIIATIAYAGYAAYLKYHSNGDHMYGIVCNLLYA